MNTALAAYPVPMIRAAAADVEVQIMSLLTMINQLSSRPTTKRNAAVIEEMTATVAELELDAARLLDMELAAEAAEVVDESPAALSAARAAKRAMRDAKASTTAIVRGAAAVGRHFEKIAPGCCIKTGDIRTWEIVDEETGDSYRLTLSPGATTGVLRYSRHSSI